MVLELAWEIHRLIFVNKSSTIIISNILPLSIYLIPKMIIYYLKMIFSKNVICIIDTKYINDIKVTRNLPILGGRQNLQQYVSTDQSVPKCHPNIIKNYLQYKIIYSTHTHIHIHTHTHRTPQLSLREFLLIKCYT